MNQPNIQAVGQGRRYIKRKDGGFIYDCPHCLGLVSSEQMYCICGHDLSAVGGLPNSPPNS